MSWQERVRRPSSGALVGLVFGVLGCVIGIEPLRDNSFLTHLATGRVILDDWSIPTHDIYSFTARGEPWVVQSWLASVIFAGAERLGGAAGIRVLLVVVSALLALLSWRLTRPGEGMLARVAAMVLVIGVATGTWAERPYLLALLLLLLTLLAADGGLDPRWLILVFWVWVNVHGSFPLGLLVIGVLAIGTHLDHQRTTTEVGALRWAVLGTVLGAINPIGPRLLLFPVELLQRSGSLAYIQEWQAPRFTSFAERAFLLEVVVAIVGLARRPSYRTGLVIAVVTALALLGSRNVPVASLVLVPAVAHGLRGLGSIPTTSRPATGLIGAAAMIAGTVLVVVAGLQGPHYVTEHGYPVRALAWLEDNDIDTRDVPTATQDFVGNYLELIHGPGANTFFDDRVDMYPQELIEQYALLNGGEAGWREVLDDHEVALVVWANDEPLAALVVADPAWRSLYVDDQAVVVCRRGVRAGALSC